MSFLHKLRKRIRASAPLRAHGEAVKFEYGCPKCALAIYRAYQDSNGPWPVVTRLGTRVVKGVPPFSYQCKSCDSLWRVSDPQDRTREDSYMWYASYNNGTWHLFSVDDCPCCHVHLGRYREHTTGDRQTDHFWCMNCGTDSDSD